MAMIEFFEEGGIADLIYFDDTIIAEDLALQANGNDLEIYNKINDDVITIKEFFSHDNRRIEYAEFADGDKFNFSNIVTADLGNLNYETTYSINGYALLNEEKLTKIKLLNYGDGNSDYSNITSYTQQVMALYLWMKMESYIISQIIIILVMTCLLYLIKIVMVIV